MNSLVWSSSRSSVRCLSRRLRSATNDSSPARTSTQLSTNVTLSKSRFSTFRRRSSKNCSETMSRSAMAITLIVARLRLVLLLLVLLGGVGSRRLGVAGAGPVTRAASV